VVLRVGGDGDQAGLGTEVAALALAAEHGLPVPRLLAAEVVAGRPVVLVEQVPGSSAIPAARPPDRLRTLGRVAAALHAALCFGPEAAGDVLASWEEAAGRPAADVAHWDVVATLSTPPDMGWFPGAIAGG
jgi:Ser/Thr protein kinase RdoA (MazF antagonist)